MKRKSVQNDSDTDSEYIETDFPEIRECSKKIKTEFERVQKEVEKLLRGGNNFASMSVQAEVCLHCGERFYTPEVIERFEKIELMLERGKTENFQKLGQAFQVAY